MLIRNTKEFLEKTISNKILALDIGKNDQSRPMFQTPNIRILYCCALRVADKLRACYFNLDEKP